MPAPPEIVRWQDVIHSGHFDQNIEMARDLLENSSLSASQIIAKLAAKLPDAVAAQPAAATAPKQEPEEKPALSVETRRFLFQEMAGPRLSAFASALAETTATVDEAASAIAVARAGLAPEKPAASGPHPGVWWRQPEFQSDGMGGDLSPMTTKADTVKKAWAKAFSKVQGRETL